MAIVIHTIGRNQYAYEHTRVGATVKSTYMGRAGGTGITYAGAKTYGSDTITQHKTPLKLQVITYNKRKNSKSIIEFPISEKEKALKLFNKFHDDASKGKQPPIIFISGREDKYEPIYDASVSKYEAKYGVHAGKFSREREFNEWVKENE